MAAHKHAVGSDHGADHGRRRNRTAEVHDGAIAVFYEKGYAAATIKDVADAVGVLKGSLYHYITSKEDLLADIVDDAYADAMTIIDEVTALDVPPIERLRVYLERHVRWYLENIERATVSFREWRNLSGSRYDDAAERSRASERFVIGLIEDCKQAGDVPPGLDAPAACHFILGPIYAVPHRRPRLGPESPRTIAKIAADITVAALVGSDPARDHATVAGRP